MTVQSEATSIRLGETEDGTEVRLSLAGLFSSRLLVQADSGGGKSYMLRLIAERIAPFRQVIIVDIEGEYSTLRAVIEDLVVVGGDASDVALPPDAKRLAGILRQRQTSAVIDLSDLSTVEQRQYARDFLDGLTEAPRELWHPLVVMMDEAQDLAPESGKGESCATEAVARVMKRGRKRFMAGLPATQRFSSCSKEVTNLCRTVLVGPTAPTDTKRAAELMGIPAKSAGDLAVSGPGEWIGRGPALCRVAVRFRADLPETSPPRTGAIGDVPAPKRAVKRLAAEISKLGVLNEPSPQPEARTNPASTAKDLTMSAAPPPVPAALDLSQLAKMIADQLRPPGEPSSTPADKRPANAVATGRPAPTEVPAAVATFEDPAEEARYQRFKARLAAEAPQIVEVLTARPELRVVVQRQVVEIDGTTVEGRIARLIADEFFRSGKKVGEVRSILKARGADPGQSSVTRVLGSLKSRGFLTYTAGGRYEQVASMLVNVVERN